MLKAIILICCLLCFYPSCLKNKKEVWLTYNVENLFDNKLDGSEYRESRSLHYVENKDDSRLNVINNIRAEYSSDLKVGQLAHVLIQIRKEYGKLGVVILQEVENANILRILHANTISLQPLKMVFAKQKNHSIGLAILTRHPIKKIEQLDASLFHKQTRPILLVTITINNQEIVIIGVHLPSQKKRSNEKIRHDILRMLFFHIQKALANNQMVFFGGDINEDLTKISHTIFPQFDPKIPLIEDKSLLRNGYDYIDHQGLKKSTYSHNMKWGTYSFRQQWIKLDHLLFSSHFFDQKGLELVKVLIYNPSFLLKRTNDDFFIPRSFKQGFLKGIVGYSDHLPLIAVIKH